jgi:hypothetical protein
MFHNHNFGYDLQEVEVSEVEEDTLKEEQEEI